MELRHSPFPLIFSQGDEVTKLACLEFFGLGDSAQAQTLLLSLVKQQRPHGAFPSRLDPEHWGMRETVRNALLLLSVGMPPEGVNVDSAVRFMLEHQNPDGGWSENPALSIPPGWTWLSSERSVTWLSADVVELLRQVGMDEHPQCLAAAEWLKGMQDEEGGWPSLAEGAESERSGPADPDATAQIGFLMGELYGEDAPVYVKAKGLFERHLNDCAQDVERGYWVRSRDGKKEQLDVYHLTHLLLSWPLDPPRRFQSGYDASDHRVQRMMETLVDIQRADGGWRPFMAEESSPVYTLLAVKALILSGVLGREALEAEVDAYCA